MKIETPSHPLGSFVLHVRMSVVRTGIRDPAMNLLNFEKTNPDQHIYRIMPQDYVFGLFAQRRNFLSRIHNWKDKFENFQLKLGGILDGEAFAYGFAEDFVGQCWTRDAYSEAMWGVYANDPAKRFLRIRSTPKKLLSALVKAHPETAQDRCFLGKVEYRREAELEAWLHRDEPLKLSAAEFARPLLMKRRAFRHEREVRLLYLGDKEDQDERGLYSYPVDPHTMITQIMADPNRDRHQWAVDKALIEAATGFKGDIKRSKIYDPPEWQPPKYRT